MGSQRSTQWAFLCEFSLEEHLPQDHLIRVIDRFVDLGDIRNQLNPFYSLSGRHSIDPELLIRMLLVEYCFGIRSERRLLYEVHLNLACRWFCRLDLSDWVPDHSIFSKNRHGRVRDSDLFRHLFGIVLARCIAEGLVGRMAFGADAFIIKAEASRYTKAEIETWNVPE
jgi:transposase